MRLCSWNARPGPLSAQWSRAYGVSGERRAAPVSGRRFVHFGKGGNKSITLAGLGFDETGLAPIVLQLRPQIPDMAVDHVALGHVIDAPQRVHNLVAAQ